MNEQMQKDGDTHSSLHQSSEFCLLEIMLSLQNGSLSLIIKILLCISSTD
jgi:hypothetical protein